MKLFTKQIIVFLVLMNLSVFAQFNYQREWATYYFGSSSASDSTIDNQANIIAVGNAAVGINLPTNFQSQFTTPNVYMQDVYHVNGNTVDCFISKFRPDGTLVFATYFGGESMDIVQDVAVDSLGAIYIYGRTSSTFQIATSGAYITQYSSIFREINTQTNVGFLTKFSPTGQLVWSTYIPCSNPTYTTGSYLYINKATNSIYIMGNTVQGNTNLVTAGAFNQNFQTYPQLSTTLNTNGVLLKFDTNGNKVAGTYFGAATTLGGITIDDDGNVIISGSVSTETNENNATPGSYQSTRNGTTRDGFIAKFSADLSTKIWYTYFPQGFHRVKSANNDLYLLNNLNLVKFSASGGLLWTNNVWSPNSYSSLNDISIKNNFIYIVGSTQVATGLTTAGTYQEAIGNANYISDGYFAQYNTDGTGKIWSSYYGGGNNDYINSVAAAADDGSFYLIGTSYSQSNIATSGSLQPNLILGFKTMFLAKFKPIALGNKNFVNTSNLQLSPNPNNGIFSLQGNCNSFLNNSQLVIYDNLGRAITSQKIVQNNQESINQEFNFKNELSQGVYFAKIINANEILQVFKVVVK